MAESEIAAMKETLRAQQQLLQKLYAELDQEREASSSAASEAMDMILRLQGEKAAVKMEASHYKRMAEEKIGHAEATLEVFEELMYQKEMEIASLEFQVLAYKHKLLTLGSDFNASDFVFPEDLQLSTINDKHKLLTLGSDFNASDFVFPEDLQLSTINDQQQHNGENDQISNDVRRLNSLPPIQVKNTLRANRKRDRSPSPIPKAVHGRDQEIVNSASFDLPKKAMDYSQGTLDAYWNQIQSLDEKLKVCGDLRSRRGKSCSIFSQGSLKITFPDKENYCEGTQEREAVASPSCSVNVHDVFEVPQTSEKHEVSEHGKKRLDKWISDVDNRLTKPDSMSEEIIESHVKLDMEKLRRNMLGTHHHHHREIKKTSPKDMKNILWQKKEGMDVDCNAQAEFQKLNQRIDRLERERIGIRQEIKHEEGDGEEHLRLLKDIQNQLNSIHMEMRSLKTKKFLTKKEQGEGVSLDPLQEAMIYFWI